MGILKFTETNNRVIFIHAFLLNAVADFFFASPLNIVYEFILLRDNAKCLLFTGNYMLHFSV